MRIIVPLILGAALALGSLPGTETAWAGEDQTVELSLRQIHELRQKGDIETAASQARSLLDAHPADLDAHVAYQDLQLALGKEKQVAREYAARAKGKTAAADDFYLYGRLLDGQASVGQFKKALAKDADHFWSHCEMGAELLDMGRAKHAAASLIRATELRPESGVAVNALGRLREAEGEIAKAEALYKRAIGLDEHMVVARVNLGVLLVGAQRFDEADVVLREAVRRAPRDPMPLMGLGMSAMSRGVPEEAAEVFEQALELDGNSVSGLHLLANAYLNLDRGELAEKALAKALSIDPKNAETHAVTSYAFISRGEIDRARLHANKAVKLDSRNPYARYMVGLCHQKDGSPKKAESEFKRAIRLDAEDPLYLRALGALQKSQARWRDAVKTYEKLVKLTDRGLDSLYDLAKAYTGASKPKKAAALLREVVSADPDDLNAWFRLGVLNQDHLRNKEGAAAAYREYIKRGGKDERVPLWLSEVEPD